VPYIVGTCSPDLRRRDRPLSAAERYSRRPGVRPLSSSWAYLHPGFFPVEFGAPQRNNRRAPPLTIARRRSPSRAAAHRLAPPLATGLLPPPALARHLGRWTLIRWIGSVRPGQTRLDWGGLQRKSRVSLVLQVGPPTL
jgi:hypothetical protein